MKSRSPRFQGCQVLSVSPTGRHIWRIHVGKQDVSVAAETTLGPEQVAKRRSAAQDWRALFRPQLNIAWLPAESVFIRAVQLPASDPAELPAMVEFQLDKISPLPVNQIVWTATGVAHPDGQQQTALVTIAARAPVEEFLNREVATGFIADQLDFPPVRRWKEVQPQADGLWLWFEDASDYRLCLAGWFVGGVWRDVSLLHLPVGDASGPALINQLGQMAWAGEMDGWLHGVPKIYVGAEPGEAAKLFPLLNEWTGQTAEEFPLPPLTNLALASARELRQPSTASLMPADWAAAQRQKFIDRLWLSGLGALGLAYVAFLFVFLIVLNVRKYQRDDLRSEVAAMGITYTNTLQLKAQVAILEEQVALRYAALDAWRAVVNGLPAELTLTQLDFQRGRTLTLSGSVSPDSTAEVTKFNSELKRAEANGQLLFANVKPARIESRPGLATSWSFDAELRRSDTP